MTDVYYNRRKWMWSLRERGRVVGYADQVCMRDVTLVVSLPGVMRVRRSGQRAVCAFARGTVVDETWDWDSKGEGLGFDADIHDSFVNFDGRGVAGCQRLLLPAVGPVWAWGLQWL
ncbi:hypothetical protein ACLBXO_00020 [Methylobacterium sp. C33D]